MSHILKLGKTIANIEWDMTPDLAFCTFSAKGLRDELVNTKELICYFFIDNWGTEPKLFLMERGVRHVNILAEIKAPAEMITACITKQGTATATRGNFPIDDGLKSWLIAEVIETEKSPYLFRVIEEQEAAEDMGAALPEFGKTDFSGNEVTFPDQKLSLADDQIDPILLEWNFYDSVRNPQGQFDNALADNGDGLTVVDERTGLMWQRVGLDICSIRSMTKTIDQLNKDGYAGFHDWRLPTLEEAMSLMESSTNAKGLHLHPCFSKEQPFIFVANKRKPTGYWFVDYSQGKAYWSSGTVPGGFSRLCRTV